MPASTNNKPLKKKSLFAQNLERQGKLKTFYNLNNIHQTSNLAQNEQIRTVEKSTTEPKANVKQLLENSSGLLEKRKQIITGNLILKKLNNGCRTKQ